MSTLKTKIEKKIVLEFLIKNFTTDVRNLSPISGGEGSQAFSFLSKSKKFIIRVHSKKEGFEKDKYAYEHFNSKRIPIPKTFQIGRLSKKLYYSITGKAKGETIERLTKDEICRFNPQLIKTLDAIHNYDVSKASKFGDWNFNGQASNISWKSYLSEFTKKFNFYKNKKQKRVFLEEDVVRTILVRYKELINYCPNLKYLVHGDYGFNNLLSDGNKPTGVIDWELSKYGDFLYDVAWLSFWETKVDYADIFQKHYKNIGISVPNFQERVLCYKLHFGLGALHFFSASDQKKKYNLTKKRLLKLI